MPYVPKFAEDKMINYSAYLYITEATYLYSAFKIQLLYNFIVLSQSVLPS